MEHETFERPLIKESGDLLLVLCARGTEPQFCTPLTERGVSIVRLPTIDIEPLPIGAHRLTAWKTRLAAPAILLVSSANAVRCAPFTLIETMKAHQAHLWIITMGQATSALLEKRGIQVTFTPPPGTTSESLLEAAFFKEACSQCKEVIFLSGRGGRQVIAETLRARQTNLHWFHVYKQSKIAVDRALLQRLQRRTGRTCLLAMSVNALENFHAALSLNGVAFCDWLYDQPCVVISERIAKKARTLGLQKLVISKGTDAEAVQTALTALGFS